MDAGLGFSLSICFGTSRRKLCSTHFLISHGFNVLMSGVRLVVALVGLHVVVLRADEFACLDVVWWRSSIS